MEVRIGKQIVAVAAILLAVSLSGCAITINRPVRQQPACPPCQKPPLRDSRSTPEKPVGPIYDMPRRVDADPYWRDMPKPFYFFQFRW